MKLKHIIEARLAYQWEPKTLTKQWLEIADPKIATRWNQSQKQDYEEFVQWIQRHEDELNSIYEELAHGWDEFKRETEPPRNMFDPDRGDWEYEYDWDTSDFKPYEQFSHTKAFKQLSNAEDYDDDFFENALEQMSYVVMQG